jgi:hypothetical protein
VNKVRRLTSYLRTARRLFLSDLHAAVHWSVLIYVTLERVTRPYRRPTPPDPWSGFGRGPESCMGSASSSFLSFAVNLPGLLRRDRMRVDHKPQRQLDSSRL